jgi:hypothetical protein
MDEMRPQLSAPGVKMPVLMIQVKDDAWTKNPEDGQKPFYLLASKDKELFWTSQGLTDTFERWSFEHGRTYEHSAPIAEHQKEVCFHQGPPWRVGYGCHVSAPRRVA